MLVPGDRCGERLCPQNPPPEPRFQEGGGNRDEVADHRQQRAHSQEGTTLVRAPVLPRPFRKSLITTPIRDAPPPHSAPIRRAPALGP